jgi:hypothetical protein
MKTSDDRFVLGSTEGQRQNFYQHGEALSLLADQLLALGGEKVVVPADDPHVAEFWLTLVLRAGKFFDLKRPASNRASGIIATRTRYVSGGLVADRSALASLCSTTPTGGRTAAYAMSQARLSRRLRYARRTSATSSMRPEWQSSPSWSDPRYTEPFPLQALARRRANAVAPQTVGGNRGGNAPRAQGSLGLR